MDAEDDCQINGEHHRGGGSSTSLPSSSYPLRASYWHKIRDRETHVERERDSHKNGGWHTRESMVDAAIGRETRSWTLLAWLPPLCFRSGLG
jgi:hypothetical protein